jgi:aminoglycoside phosphotransferase (APT) family kinase protein
MLTVIPQEQLLQLLRRTFGARVEIASSRVGNQQPDYLVLLLRLRHPSISVVVKLAGPGAIMACAFDRTAALDRLVAAQTTIPMPEILGVDISCQDWPWRYLIKTHIPGQEWAGLRGQMSTQELSSAYRQIGSAVSQLHAIHFPGFGELAADGSVQEDEAYFPALTKHARAIIQSDRLREQFLCLLESQEPLFLDVRQASLCHEDLHQHNILFQYQQGQWRLATILDFDKAWAGHSEIDLARLELWRGMTSEAFWQAYQAARPIDPRYPERRPIYQLLWCLEYAQPTAEHLADTRRLCAELGLPRIERFD